jgi:four helix bundle protein
MYNPDKLRVARDSEDLADLIYDFTANFPRDERFGLTAQMRSAAVSVGSNIFEGCGRRGSKAFVAFLYNSSGSASELLFQTRFARRRRFSDPQLAGVVLEKLGEMRGSLTRLIRYHEGQFG